MVIEKPLRNIVGKGEHVGYHLFFSTLFFRAFFCMVVKTLDYVSSVYLGILGQPFYPILPPFTIIFLLKSKSGPLFQIS